jgi:hypothetical protein
VRASSCRGLRLLLGGTDPLIEAIGFGRVPQVTIDCLSPQPGVLSSFSVMLVYEQLA